MQQFSVRLPKDLHDELRDHVYRERTTLQQVCTAALRAYLRGTPNLGIKMSPRESNRLAAALDLLRRGPSDLKRLLNHLLDFWLSVGKAG